MKNAWRILALMLSLPSSIIACGGGGKSSGSVTCTIAVAPAPATVVVGYGRRFTATDNHSDGSTKDLTTAVTWRPSDSAVASVSGVGLATGLSTGSTSIMATLGAVTGSAALTVEAPPVFGCCVDAIATGPDGTIYVGGSFTQVGPPTGSGVPIDAVTGQRVAVFPGVRGAPPPGTPARTTRSLPSR